MSAGEVQPYFLSEALFTAYLLGGKVASQGKMLPPHCGIIHYSTPFKEKKQNLLHFLNFNFTAQNNSLPIASPTPTQRFQRKKALCHLLAQKLVAAKSQGPAAAAE